MRRQVRRARHPQRDVGHVQRVVDHQDAAVVRTSSAGSGSSDSVRSAVPHATGTRTSAATTNRTHRKLIVTGTVIPTCPRSS
jgi:hypothetical protein